MKKYWIKKRKGLSCINPHSCKLPVLADRTFIKGNLISKIFLKATRGTFKSTTRARAIRAVSVIRKPLSQKFMLLPGYRFTQVT